MVAGDGHSTGWLGPGGHGTSAARLKEVLCCERVCCLLSPPSRPSRVVSLSSTLPFLELVALQEGATWVRIVTQDPLIDAKTMH